MTNTFARPVKVLVLYSENFSSPQAARHVRSGDNSPAVSIGGEICCE